MKKTEIKNTVVGIALIAIVAGVIGYCMNFVIPTKAAETEAVEETTTSWDEFVATEYFEDEFISDLEEDWGDLRSGGFTSYSYDIAETDVNGIFKCQVDMIYKDNNTISLVIIYDVYEDDGYLYGLIDGEHVSFDIINDRYDW